jgi:hypothetical protein
MVEDTTLDDAEPDSDMDISPIEATSRKPLVHTARPPVELME